MTSRQKEIKKRRDVFNFLNSKDEELYVESFKETKERIQKVVDKLPHISLQQALSQVNKK